MDRKDRAHCAIASSAPRARGSYATVEPPTPMLRNTPISLIVADTIIIYTWQYDYVEGIVEGIIII